MPNVVLKTDKSLFDIKDTTLFFNLKSVFLHPVELSKESFFLRLYQNGDRIIIKLEKATMPKITNDLKSYIMNFAVRIKDDLNAEILHHNLNATPNPPVELYDKYEITTAAINSVEYINSLCSNKNVSLEIGIGSGEFIADKAKNNQKESFIGAEILNSDFNIAIRRFDKANLNNVKAIRYDARAVLDRFKPNSLKNVYLNFPEPWFKHRRIKHSVLTTKTAVEIEKILSKNGTFDILTDNRPFAVSAAVIIESSTSLKKTDKYSIRITDENIKTKYEKKWIKYKRTIYKLQYIKENETEYKSPAKFDFPVNIELKNRITKDYVLKILNLYSNPKKDEKIIEMAVGYAKNPQHIFLGLKKGLLYLLPQSNFVINSDFVKAISMSLQQGK